MSGIPYRNKEFLETQLTSSARHGGRTQRSLTPLPGINGVVAWCEERNTDPFSATIAEIADFLTHQFRDGKQYSTINSYRSAISNTHPHIEGYPTGKHPIICRLMQGVFNERPSEPKYSEIWDIDEVLLHLESMTDLGDFPFKELTLKPVMLMALSNADRASDLHLLDLIYMQIQPDKIKFLCTGII